MSVVNMQSVIVLLIGKAAECVLLHVVACFCLCPCCLDLCARVCIVVPCPIAREGGVLVLLT